MPPKKETELLNLENFSVAQLPELQGKKEEIKAIIDANPVEEVIITEIVDVKEIETVTEPVNESLVEKLTPIVEKQSLADLKEVQNEASWDTIFKDFKLSGEKSLSSWLKVNYNVPTKIN